MRYERLLVAVLSLAAIQVFFWQYFASRPVHLWSDAAGYHYPLQRYAFHELKQGRLPLWDSSIYCGMTFAGNVQAALFYPPTWLLYAAEWRRPSLPFKAYEKFIFLHLWLAFVLCYCWLRARFHLLPSVLGACVCGFGGYAMYQVLHPGVLGAFAWLPLALWGVDEARARADWHPLWKVAASTALAFLAGYPAASLVNCAIVAVYAIAGVKQRKDWKMALGAVAAIAAAAPLALMQLLPALDARSFMVLEPKYGPGAYSWRALLESYLFANWLNFNPGHPLDFEPGCLYLYLGTPALFAIVWALWRRKLRPYLPPIACIAFALLLANPPQWLIGLVQHIPALNYTLQPFNFYAAIAPMAALIAAVALDDFWERRGSLRLPPWVAIAASLAALLWAYREIGIAQDDGHFASHSDSALQTALAAVLFAACLWAARQSDGRLRILTAAAMLLAVATDYGVYGAARWFNATPGDVDGEYRTYGIAGVDDDGYRAMTQNRQFRGVSNQLEGPHPLQYRIYGLATPEGFDPFITSQYKQRIERWTPFATNRMFDTNVKSDDMLQTLGVRYVTSRNDSPNDDWLAASAKFRRIGRAAVFCHVYEYLEAKPPYRWIDDREGAARPVEWLPGWRVFQVQSQRGGRFELVEQFFKGWRARVDGKPVAIEPFDGAFQAIRIPAGAHRVSFEFAPASVGLGAVLSGLAWIGLVALAWRSRRMVRER